MSLIELLMSAFLAVVLIACGGYLFTTQIRGYKDIRNQAATQAGLKKAMQGMTRQISNSGAFLPNPRLDFVPEASKLTLAYVDLRGKFCADRATVVMSFYARHGSEEDSLIQDIRCTDGTHSRRMLAGAPGGGLGLSFKYLDRNDTLTLDPAKVKAVQLDLTLQNRVLLGLPLRTRHQSIRVQCVNL